MVEICLLAHDTKCKALIVLMNGLPHTYDGNFGGTRRDNVATLDKKLCLNQAIPTNGHDPKS